MKASPTITKLAPIWLAAFASCSIASASEIDESKLPPPAKTTVDFDRDIRPIFDASCLRCHGPERPKSHFRLVDRESALKGGSVGIDILPGNSAGSPLIQYVARLDPEIQMPPVDRGAPLTAGQVGLLRAWIDQGAIWGTTNPPPRLTFSITPTFGWIGVGGNRQKFGEIEGTKGGWGGGVEQFTSREQLAPDENLSSEGHALFQQQDYRLKLALEKNETGFVRAGFESWRKYFDDRGGFYPPTNSFSLHRDLYLDIGRAWIDFGLTLPDRPQVVLGYEYQFKNGNESTLQWGPTGADPKNILPASKQIDEHTHIIKLDATYDVHDWRLVDSARVEFYKLATSRTNLLAVPSPDTYARVAENDSHIQGANTFSVNKQLNDWLSVSSGYLYSRLDGNASLKQNTLDSPGNYAFGYQWSANNITLKRESQVVSVGSLAGPWAGLTFSAGVQGEWTSQESSGLENLLIGTPASPAVGSTTNATGRYDSASARENFALRFTKIPYTAVFAEARLRQESLSRFTDSYEDGAPFRSAIDSDIEAEEYRVGFNTSPWPRVSLGANLKRDLTHTDYSPSTNSFNDSGHVYPGFIQWRDVDDNQIEARLVLRATSWLRTTFTYRWEKTDYDSATAAIPFLTPGGQIEAANYEAHVYSVNAVLTPIRRLYLSSTFSYSDSRTTTAQNGANYLAPYQGDVYSVLSSATLSRPGPSYLLF